MPLSESEGVGLSVGVMNIWHRYVDASSMRQLDILRRQYTDESIIAYIRKEETGMGIRVVKMEDFKCLRNDIIKIV